MGKVSQQESLSSQGDDQLSQATSGGGIYAEHIAATNVVSGTQIIEQQILHLPGQKPAPPLQLPRRAEHFTDREQEQSWLLDNLTASRVVTLCGPGGMGKTALVAEVLWKLAPGDTPPEIFPDGILFHSFYQQAEVTIALEQIARTFGEDLLPTPFHAARRALSRRHALLVFDGAEAADDLRQALEACAGTTVLVTSRKRSNAVNLRYLRDLHPLPEAHAVTVVQAWGVERATDEPTIRQICQLVGRLPLALRLVGRYLALHQEEAGAYLQWLQDSPLAALDQGQSQHESVPRLLGRSVSKLSQDARRALVIVGLLAPATFDRDIITQVLSLAPERARQAFNELVEYGLLLHHEQQDAVSHALIHTYAREMLLAASKRTRQRELASRLIQVLNECFAATEETDRRAQELLLPHVQACLVLIDKYGLATRESAQLLNDAGYSLYEQGRYSEGEPLLQRALAIYEQQLGPLHPDTAASLNNLALLYDSQGKYEQAEPLLQRALAIREQVLGAEHPHTIAVLENYAVLLQEMNRTDEAYILLLHQAQTKRAENVQTDSV